MAFKIIFLSLFVLIYSSFWMVTTGGMIDFYADGTFQSGVMESKALLDSTVVLKCSTTGMNIGNCSISWKSGLDQNRMSDPLRSVGGTTVISVVRKFNTDDSGYYTCICESNDVRLTRTIKIESMESSKNCFIANGQEVVLNTLVTHHCFADESEKFRKKSLWYDITDTGVARMDCPNSDCYSEVTCVAKPSISLHPKSFHSQSSPEIEFVCETRPNGIDVSWMINNKSVETYLSNRSLPIVITETSDSSILVVKEPSDKLKTVACYYHQGETVVQETSKRGNDGTHIEGPPHSEDEDAIGGMSKVVVIAMASLFGFTMLFLIFCIVLHLKCLCNIREEMEYIKKGDRKTEVPKKRVKSSEKDLPLSVSQRVSIFALGSSIDETNGGTVVEPQTNVQQSDAKTFTNDVLTLEKLDEDGEISPNPIYETCDVPNEIYI